MAVEFRNLRFTFPSQTGGPKVQVQTPEFSTNVRSAVAAINGFNIGYSNGDHELFRETIDASAATTRPLSRAVAVTVNFGLRDSSGNFDDPYEGFVDVALIVDRA
jgi:hypothetical protein